MAQRRKILAVIGFQLATVIGSSHPVEAQSANPTFRGLELNCPLRNAPREVSSRMGESRENGKRRHKGIDFVSHFGEPVRATAGGVVVFAGVDNRRQRITDLRSQTVRHLRRSALGPGGLFILIQHQNGLVSGYMHLSKKVVRKGDVVTPTQIIGYVGRTGIKYSKAHLHFELRFRGRYLNPIRILRPYLAVPRV